MSVDAIAPPPRVLLGPGPSNVPSNVLRALAQPTVGHLDPYFLARMDEVKSMLLALFDAKGAMAIPISATGSAGMECCLVNLLEPGDRILVGRNGVFGGRMAEVARRAGADVVTVDAPWGRAIDPDDLRRAAREGPFRAVAVVQAETSTGVLQDLAPLRAIADDCGALLVVDTVTSLGGVPVGFDANGIDAAYSATQKCLSCPPGLSPIALSERAIARIRGRVRPVQSWYLDVTLLLGYWGTDRVYHHTAPIHMIYALHEALRTVLAEGLAARFARHARNARALATGLESLGLELPVPVADRLAPLTLVKVPSTVDDRALRAHMLATNGIEIGGGLGELAGRALRIGLMGASSTPENVVACVRALAAALLAQGVRVAVDDALEAMRAYLDEAPR